MPVVHREEQRAPPAGPACAYEHAAAIVTEPTELELVIAHKGFVWSEIEVTGFAAHGSRPHLGVDAIAGIGPILTAIGALDDALGARTHPLLGRGSVHASLIHGGEELSSYPARCVLQIERRTLPGESVAALEAELVTLLDGCRAADPRLDVAQRTLLAREPFDRGGGAERTTSSTATRRCSPRPQRRARHRPTSSSSRSASDRSAPRQRDSPRTPLPTRG